MEARHYVIVVHGIGEQKLNQTTTPVVHRFAEVRQKKEKGHFEHLLPSHLSAQSVRQGGKGHGWSEFRGIPIKPGEAETFNGTPAADLVGHNFRFVDLHWQHILERHQERYAAPVEQWAPALLARLEDPITPKGWLPPWASPLLQSVVDVALPIRKMLGLKKAELSKKIFDGFLGDIHLYGDYARTRGKAVRHFHVILDEIMLRDFIDWCHRDKERRKQGGELTPYEPPRFTIIAHSLGSIMSFDALVYAHAEQEVRQAQRAAWHGCPSLPFLGYTYKVDAETESWDYIRGQLQELQDDKSGSEWDTHRVGFPQPLDDIVNRTATPAIPLLTWREQVDNFITLGSPIDKYHVVWWQRYLHMGLQKSGFKQEEWQKGIDKWLDPALPTRENRHYIRHYNFCDEQDPVGHHLNVARGTTNYKEIFDPGQDSERDMVFRRYAIPGVAHNMYWEDGELFKGIIEKIIDPANMEKPTDEDLSYFLKSEFQDRKKAFDKALRWAYFRVPFFAALVTGLLVSYALLSSDTMPYRSAAGLGAILLWIRPNLRKVYEDEADPDNFGDRTKETDLKTEKTEKIEKTEKRGILAHLVAGMVEWRRILLSMRKESPKPLPARKGQFDFWGRLLGRLGVALIIAISCIVWIARHLEGNWKMLWDALPNPKTDHPVAWMGIILSVSYIGTMLYVARRYLKAKVSQEA